MRKLLLVASVFSLISCVGQVGPNGQPVDNDPPEEEEEEPVDVTPPPPAGPPCKPRVTDPAQIPDGHHFPGQDCMGSCHDHGFTLGGTLVDQNKLVYPGGVITVTDAMGKTIDMIAGNNGNFYTSEALVFPVTTYASGCPDVAPMISKVQEQDAGCARSTCHTGAANGISEVYLNK